MYPVITRLAGVAVVSVLVAAGSGLALRAQLPQQTGSWVSMGSLTQARTGAASVTLPDGRTLIAGGRLPDGTVTDTVAIFDSASGSWENAGHLLAPRIGHSATLLADGRVVVIGGSVGSDISSDVELFDVAAQSSMLVSMLSQPRTRHAATRLLDGTVLVAGGTTTGGTVVASVDSFDPVTWSVTTIAGGLQHPRRNASATTLIDGRVLIAGGNDGTQDLPTAELFNPTSRLFELLQGDNALSVPRSGHTALLLPNNGSVLIAGGESNGAAVSSTDLFLPVEFPDPYSFSIGQFASATPMAAPRWRANSGPMPNEGHAFVIGGGAQDGERYRFATIRTDLDDYYPGQRAVITGSGWQPGEPVTLLFQEDPAVHDDYQLTVTADSQGNIYWDQWAPEEHDLGVRFYLTARDSKSRAQITFTDAVNKATVPTFSAVDAPATCTATTVVSSPANTPLCASSAISTNPGNPNNNFVEFLWFAPGQSTHTFAQRFPAAGVIDAATTVTASSIRTPAAAGTWTVKVCQADDRCSNASTTLASATITVTASNRTLTITGSGAGSGTVTSAPAGIACVLTAGVATGSCSGEFTNGTSVTLNASASLVTPPAGSTFDGWSGDGSGAVVRTVLLDQNRAVSASFRANQTITFDSPGGQTYGDADFSVAPVASSALPVTVSSQTIGVCTVTGSSIHIQSVGACTLRAAQAGDANYNAAADIERTFTVSAATLTIKADAASRAYGGANPAFSGSVVSGAKNGETFTVTASAAATATTPVGTYDIVPDVTGSTLTNYIVVRENGTLTITRAAATVTANDKGRTYGAANPAFDAAVTGTVNGDILAYTLATVATETTGVGMHPIVVTLGDNPNYEVTPTDGTLTITRATATVTAHDKSRTYGAANPAFDAAVTGTVNGDILAYTLATVATETTGVGMHPIVVTLGDNPNYEVTPTDGTLTITRATATVTANDKSRTYGAANPAFDAAVTGTVNGDILAYTLATVATETTGVGMHPIVVTLGDNPNYEVTPTDGTLTIIRATATVTANDKSRTYGAANPAFDAAVTGTVNNDVLAYTLATVATETTGVGMHPIVVTLGDNPNYEVTPTDGTLTITRATATVTAHDKSRTYGAANPAFDAAVTGTVNGDILAYTLATVATETTGVGMHPIVVTLGDNPNYEVTPTDGTLTIIRATATVTANDKSRTYGAANPAFDAAVTGTVNNDVLAYTLATVATETTGVGMHPIVVTLGDNPNYEVTPTDGTLTITRATATVTAHDKSRTYGAANPAFDAAVTGTVNNDVLAYTLATVATETTGVGMHPIVVTLGDNPNYEVTPTDGTLTIIRATATVTANDKSRTYGAANPAFDAAVTGTVNNDVLAYTLATVATETTGVGMHPIVVTLGDNPNYEVTPTDGTLTIIRATATVTANDKSRTYGAANPAFDAAVTGTVNNDVLAYTLATVATETTGVGMHPIVVTLGDNPNYEVTPTDGTLTITRATATVTANDKSKTYGTANPALDAAVTGTVNGDILAYTLATIVTENTGVGGYPIVVTFGINPNYDVTPVNGTLTVTARAITVAADPKSKVLAAADPTLTYHLTNGSLVAGDALTGEVVRDAGETIGQYAIRRGTLAASTNYSMTFVPNNLSIVYASGGVCFGNQGHAILQPIDITGTSVFKQGSTVPAKFRVCDVNGASIGGAGVVTSFRLVQTMNGTVDTTVNEPVESTTPDSQFRWSASDQLWIFNINTKSLKRSQTYLYEVTLDDHSTIRFQFGLK